MDRNSDAFVDSLSQDMSNKIRRLATEKEPEFNISSTAIGLHIWRIEKGAVMKWPEKQYGTFYQGDSFIVLNIISSDEHNAHLWIGSESTPDEIGTASFKILQLDEYLGKTCSIFYEAQGNESELFISYFKVLTVLQGGVDADYTNKNVQKFKPRLFHIRGVGSKIQSREVSITKENLDDDDVYVLDVGLKLFNWRGRNSNSFEKFHATYICNLIKQERNGKVEVISVDQGDYKGIADDQMKEFWSFFERVKDSKEPQKPKCLLTRKNCLKPPKIRAMKKISDAEGKLQFYDVEYSKDSLKSEDAFLIDRGDAIVIWVGKGASRNEKRFAFAYGKKYIATNRPKDNLSIITVYEGRLQNEVDKCFMT